jgi:uncharacterized protein (DUF305 family)
MEFDHCRKNRMLRSGTDAMKGRMMIKTPLLGVLLTALALLLGACGAAQPSTTTAPTAAETDQGAMPMATAAPEATMTGDMPGMDHGAMAPGAVPYDAQFIDSMIIHHEGAITMAKQALEEAERPEIKTLAEAIVTAQEQEITQLRSWRGEWYPDLATSAGMGMDMGTMEVSDDTSKPFDQRFIEAMIPHHEGAIAMARDAQQKAERQEIKDLAAEIITAQEGEIAQMKQWQQAWFGQ